MVDFRRAEANPAPVKANDKAMGAAANSNEPMMDYNDATDLGLNIKDRLQIQAQQSQETVGKLTSLVSGAKQSIAVAAYNKMRSPDFDPDPLWDASYVMAEDVRVKEQRLSPDEIKYVQGSNSLADYQYRMEQIPSFRKEQALMQANPITGVAGAIGPDIPAMLLPGVAEASFGRTFGTAVRLAADVYDAGSALYAADQLGQMPMMNGLVAGVGVLDVAHLVERSMVRVPLRTSKAPLEQAAAEVESAAAADGTRGAAYSDETAEAMQYHQSTGVHPAPEKPAAPYSPDRKELVPDPDAPTIPKSTRDIEHDIEVQGTVPDLNIAQVDHSGLLNIAVDTNKATLGKGSKAGAPLVSDIPMQPMMSRVLEHTDELAAAGKLGDDFPAQYRTLMQAISEAASDVPVMLDRKAGFRSRFEIRPDGTSAVRMSFPEAAVKSGKSNVSDVIGKMSAKDVRVFLHEAIHAATSRTIRAAERNPEAVHPTVRAAVDDMTQIRKVLNRRLDADTKAGKVQSGDAKRIKYYLSNNRELVAGLGDDTGNFTRWLQEQPSMSGKESMLRRLAKSIMQALGIKGSGRTGLTDIADAMEDILDHSTGKMGKQARSYAAPDFASDSMHEVTAAGRAAIDNAPDGAAKVEAAKAMLGAVKQRFNQFFSLRDDIARGDIGGARAAFADMLVADATKVGERTESVADLKRLMKSETDAIAAIVEKSITDQLALNGHGKLSQFFYRRDFVQARKELERKVAHYLDYAHEQYRNGKAVPAPTADIKRVVDAYVDSGWAERWHELLEQSGMVDAGGRFEKSPYYMPRRYSGDKIRELERSGLRQKDFVDAFSAAMQDAYPAMGRDLSRQVARTWYQGLTSAQPKQGAMWRRAVNGMTNDEFLDTLVENGVELEKAQQILEQSIFASERTGSNSIKNLRKRNELDMQKEYYTSSGKSLRLIDLVDTDVTKLMHQYNNRMSGRAAFSARGIKDLKEVSKQIDELRAGLGDAAEEWTSKVDDTIDTLMGYPVRTETPDVLLATGYLSNAMMLKNSGLYQLTDIAMAAKEQGMYRVVRSMFQGGLFKHVRVELGRNKDLNGRLLNILNGAAQNDMRFRWLHTLAEDNTDLTRSAQFVSVARNMGQSAYTVNGMRYIHRAMVNMNAGMIRDNILAALGGSEKDANLLIRFGMRPDALNEMRAAFKENPDAVFKPELQRHLEAVGQRYMDYVVQQNRTGETAHFAEMNPVGRVLVGYQSFAMAATNKILRRQLNDGGIGGLAILLAYQFPMMALATHARYVLDGKSDDKTTKDLVVDSVTGMSAIGGATLLAPMFQDTRYGGGVSMLGGVSNIVNTLKDIERKGSDTTIQDMSKLFPLVQETVPLRMLINNMGD